MISLSGQPRAPVQRLCDAIELAFLDDPFVRFIVVLDPVLTVVACGRQELLDRIDAVRAAATEGSGRKTHRLADLEFVILHRSLRYWLRPTGKRSMPRKPL